MEEKLNIENVIRELLEYFFFVFIINLYYVLCKFNYEIRFIVIAIFIIIL